MKGANNMEKYITTGELARRLGKCRETVNYRIKTGKLKPSLFIQGRAFFIEEEIVKFESEQQKSLPKTFAA